MTPIASGCSERLTTMASLIRLYSLSDADRDFILSKRGARNQLGMAVQTQPAQISRLWAASRRRTASCLWCNSSPSRLARPGRFSGLRAPRHDPPRAFWRGVRNVSDCGHARAPIGVICSSAPPTRRCRRTKAPRSSAHCSNACVTTGSFCRPRQASNGSVWRAALVRGGSPPTP